MSETVWSVTRTDDSAPQVCEDLNAALSLARSIMEAKGLAITVSRPSRDTYLLGPGDGTTTVMVCGLPSWLVGGTP